MPVLLRRACIAAPLSCCLDATTRSLGCRKLSRSIIKLAGCCRRRCWSLWRCWSQQCPQLRWTATRMQSWSKRAAVSCLTEHIRSLNTAEPEQLTHAVHADGSAGLRGAARHHHVHSCCEQLPERNRGQHQPVDINGGHQLDQTGAKATDTCSARRRRCWSSWRCWQLPCPQLPWTATRTQSWTTSLPSTCAMQMCCTQGCWCWRSTCPASSAPSRCCTCPTY